jgi:hypothetical protein
MAPNNKNANNKQQVPAAASSPLRKSKPDRSGGPPKLSNANILKYYLCGAEGIAVARVYKPDGMNNAFLGGILPYIKQDEDRKEKCQLVLITELRNPDGTNEPYETTNKAGSKYPTEALVICTQNDASVSAAVSALAQEMSSVAKNECKTEWKYGIPFFINKGNATPQDLRPLSHYLMDSDCASIIKRSFENCEDKNALLNNSNKDAILGMIFGSAEAGNAAIESIDEGLYFNL